jgi:hypothetical protein
MKNKNKVFKAIYLADYVPDVMKRIEGSLLDNKARIDYAVRIDGGALEYASDSLKNDCPSSNKWNRRRVYLKESFVPRFQFTRRIADSATDASRWSFS